MQVCTAPEEVQLLLAGHMEPGFALNVIVNFADHAPAQFVVVCEQTYPVFTGLPAPLATKWGAPWGSVT